MRALECITAKKLEKSSAAALTMVAGTAEDKSRLIRGMPTGLDVHVLLDIASMVRGDRPAMEAKQAKNIEPQAYIDMPKQS